ncbi:MAG: hypothetical protein JXM75_00820 [Chromatiaceae bacterium]|nr:hypothetical protein [Chromatiaceae bacterium]
MPRIATVTTLLISLALGGCLATPLESSWVAPEPPNERYERLLVVGLADNAQIRAAYEDHLSYALSEFGVEARNGHEQLRNKEWRSSRRLRQASARLGAEGVLITHLACDEHSEPSASPSLHQIGEQARALASYHAHVINDIDNPEYYAQKRPLRLETNLYDAQSAALIWSGRSAILQPDAEHTTLSELTKATVQRLHQDGLIGKPADGQESP